MTFGQHKNYEDPDYATPEKGAAKAKTVGPGYAARQGIKYNDTSVTNMAFPVQGQASRESNQQKVNSRHGMPYKKPTNFLGDGGPVGEVEK